MADAIALLDHLEIEQAVTLGHSGGGITAFQIAARHPRRVSAIVNVEGPVCDLDDGPSALSFVLSLPCTASDRQALLDAIGPLAPMLGDKLRPTADGGRRLPFHPQDTIASERGTHGDHRADWTFPRPSAPPSRTSWTPSADRSWIGKPLPISERGSADRAKWTT